MADFRANIVAHVDTAQATNDINSFVNQRRQVNVEVNLQLNQASQALQNLLRNLQSQGGNAGTQFAGQFVQNVNAGLQNINATSVVNQIERQTNRMTVNIRNSFRQLNNQGNQFNENVARTFGNNMTAWANNNSKAVQVFGNRLTDLHQRLEQAITAQDAGAVRQIREEFRLLQSEARATGNIGKTFADSFASSFSTVSKFVASYVSVYRIFSEFKQGVQNVIELDTALVDLQKTSSATSSQLNEFYKEANDVAKQYGTSTKQIIQGAADWSRLGYNLEDSKQMSKLSSQFAAISPGMSVDEATEGLVSTMKAFKIESDDVLDGIMSKVNAVGNSFALSNNDIMDALKNSSSAMAVANNSLDETIALITAGTEIVQDASRVGNGLRTISMRIRGMNEETEELDENLVNIKGDVYELTNNKVSIMEDENTYKSTYQILSEISEVWDQLSDKNQAELLDKLFGKARAQIGAAIISNFSQAEKAITTMSESAGAADREMDIIINSLEYKINRFRETITGIWQNLLDRGDIGKVVDTATSFIEVIDKIVDKLGLLKTVAITGVVGYLASGFLKASRIVQASGGVTTQLTALGQAMPLLSQGFERFGQVTANATGILSIFRGALSGIFAIIEAHPILAAITAAVTLAAVINKISTSAEKAQKEMTNAYSAYDEAKTKVENINNELKTTRDRIDELEGKKGLTFVEEQELQNLREANELLENQLKLAQLQETDAKREAANSVVKAYNETYKPSETMKTRFGDDVISQEGLDEISGFFEGKGFMPSYVEGTSDIFNQLLAYRNTFKEVKELEEQYKNSEQDLYADEDYLKASNNLGDIKSDLLDQLSILTDYKEKLEDIPIDERDIFQTKALEEIDDWIKLIWQELDPAYWKQFSFDKVFNSDAFAQAKQDLLDIATTSSKIGIDENDVNNVFSRYTGLQKAFEDAGFTVEDIVNQINAAIDAETKTVKEAFNLSDSAEALNDWYNNLSDDDKELAYTVVINNTEEAREKLKTELEELSEGGNVELAVRPVIDANLLNEKGWDAGEGSATVFTNTYSSKDNSIAMNFTPILVEDGKVKEVLTPEELQSYAERVIEGAEDEKGLKIGATFEGENAIKEAENFAETLHEKQELYYLLPDPSKMDVEAYQNWMDYFRGSGDEGSSPWKGTLEDFDTLFDKDSTFNKKVTSYTEGLDTLKSAIDKFNKGELSTADIVKLRKEFKGLGKYTDKDLDKGLKKVYDDLLGVGEGAESGEHLLKIFDDQIEELEEQSPETAEALRLLRDEYYELYTGEGNGEVAVTSFANVKESLTETQKLATALSEVSKNGHLAEETITSLVETNEGYKNVLQQTASGMVINTLEATKMAQEQNQLNLEIAEANKVAAELSYQRNYNEMVELAGGVQELQDILDSGIGDPTIFELNDLNTDLSKEISQWEALSAEIRGTMSLLQQYKDAQSTSNLGDYYETIKSGLKGADELYEQGWLGRDDFISYAKLLAKNGATDEEAVAQYEQNRQRFAKYLETDTAEEGILNFWTEATELTNEAGEAFVKYDKDTDNFEFNIDSMNEFADAMGVNTEMAEYFLFALKDLGYLDIDLSMIGDSFKESVENIDLESDSAVESLNHLINHMSELEEKGIDCSESLPSIANAISTLNEAGVDIQPLLDTLEELGYHLDFDSETKQFTFVADTTDLENAEAEIDGKEFSETVDVEANADQAQTTIDELVAPETKEITTQVTGDTTGATSSEQDVIINVTQNPDPLPVNTSVDAVTIEQDGTTTVKTDKEKYYVQIDQEGKTTVITDKEKYSVQIDQEGKTTVTTDKDVYTIKINQDGTTTVETDKEVYTIPINQEGKTKVELDGKIFTVEVNQEGKTSVSFDQDEYGVIVNQNGTTTVTTDKEIYTIPVNQDGVTTVTLDKESAEIAITTNPENLNVDIDSNGDVLPTLEEMQNIADQNPIIVNIETNNKGGGFLDAENGSETPEGELTIENVDTSEVEPVEVKGEAYDVDTSNAQADSPIDIPANVTDAHIPETVVDDDVTVTVSADDSQFETEIAEDETKISELDEKSSESELKANGEPAETEMTEVESELANLDATTSDPTITANDQATGTMNAVDTRGQQLDGKVYTVTMKTVTVNETSAGGGGGGHGFANGTFAYANGRNISVSENQEALVNELGEETLVRNGRAYIINGGAQLLHLKKGDIIFNHKQTEELRKYGQVVSGNGRGRAFASGSFNAFYDSSASGTSGRLGGKKVTTTTSAPSSSYSGSSGTGYSGGSSSGGSQSSGSKDSSSDDKNKTFDWIERAIKKIKDAIETLKDVADNIYNSIAKRDKALDQQSKKIAEQIDLQLKGAKRYQEEADKIALDSSIIDKIKNGTIDISEYDKDTAENIENYQKWFDKMVDCQEAAEKLKKELIEIEQEKFDLIIQKYDDALQDLDHTMERTEALIDRRNDAASEYVKQNTGKSNDTRIKEIEGELAKLQKGGGVNLLNRPQVKTSNLSKAGWSDVGKGYATLFSSTFSNSDESVAMNFTPILVDENGNYLRTLSPDELQKYAEEVIDGVHDDYLKLKIGATFEGDDAIQQAVNAAEQYHNLHEELYSLRNSSDTGNASRENIASYQELILQAQEKIAKKEEELAELRRQLQAALDSGMDQNSEGYHKMEKEIYDVENDIDDLYSSVIGYSNSIAEEYNNLFNNVATKFENRLAQTEHLANEYNTALETAEAKGLIASDRYYRSLQAIEKTNLRALRNEYDQLMDAMAEALASGAIEKGSQAWYDMTAKINETAEAIKEAELNVIELNNSIRQVKWDNFDYMEDQISRLTSEADFLIDLLSDAKMVDDKGAYTDEGLSTMGLHGQNYNTLMLQADDYAQQIKEINKEIANDPANTDLIARKQELYDTHQKLILAANKEKQAIKGLVEEGIKAELASVKKLIDEYKTSLDSQKNLYDYQKKVADQTKNIANLRKQLAAYENDLTEETRAKVQKIRVSIDEAQEELEQTEYEKYLTDQKKLLDDLYSEYEKILNERLDNLDYLMEEAIATINSNAQLINQTLITVTREVGYSMTEEMRSVWNTQALANKENIQNRIDECLKVINKLAENGLISQENAKQITDALARGDATAIQNAVGIIQKLTDNGNISTQSAIEIMTKLSEGDAKSVQNALKVVEQLKSNGTITQQQALKLLNGIVVGTSKAEQNANAIIAKLLSNGTITSEQGGKIVASMSKGDANAAQRATAIIDKLLKNGDITTSQATKLLNGITTEDVNNQKSAVGIITQLVSDGKISAENATKIITGMATGDKQQAENASKIVNNLLANGKITKDEAAKILLGIVSEDQLADLYAKDAAERLQKMGLISDVEAQTIKGAIESSANNSDNVLAKYQNNFSGQLTTLNSTVSGIKASVDALLAKANEEASKASQSIKDEQSNKKAVEKKATTTTKKATTTTKKVTTTTKKATTTTKKKVTTTTKRQYTEKEKYGVALAICNGGYGWGLTSTRMSNLTAKGFDANEIQGIVNQLCREGYVYSGAWVGKYYGITDLSPYHIKNFAKGAKRINRNALAWTNENADRIGGETILRASDHAVLTSVGSDDRIYNAMASENLWNLANNPTRFLASKLVGLSGGSSAIGNTVSIDNMNFNLPNVKNYEEFVTAMQKDRKFESMIQQMTLGAMMGKNNKNIIHWSN